MTSRSFIDTNVAVYAVDFAQGETARQQIAADLLASQPDELTVSTQVLGEFYVVVTRKLKKPMTQREGAAATRSLGRLAVVSIDKEVVVAAMDTSEEAQLSYWDALIIEAARQGGCDRVLTEDMSDGQVIRGIQIENPFRGVGDQ